MLLSFALIAQGQMTLSPKFKTMDALETITDVETFYKEAPVSIDFDKRKPGTRVNSLYKENGVLFSSSNEDNSVSIQLYSFRGGRSKKRCIASAKPTYEGKLNIELLEKKVVQVGFNLSHVNKGGTIVDVFGTDGRQLGRLEISKPAMNGLAFCGLKSKVPISKIVVSPVQKIDPDFALDDFAFTNLSK